MKRRRLRVWSFPVGGRQKVLLLVTGVFAAGAILGCFWAAWMKGSSFSALSDYLEGFLAMDNGSMEKKEVLGRVVQTIRLPLAVFFLRFTVFGVLLIPALLFVKGFILAFSVASFVKCYGWTGEAAAWLLYGLPSAAEVAVMFLLGVEGWLIAQRRGNGPLPRGERMDVKLVLLCFAFLTAVSVLQSLTRGGSVWLLQHLLVGVVQDV